MRCGRTLIALAVVRATSQLHQGALQSALESEIRLAITHSSPLPIGIRQYHVDQEMIKASFAQLDLQVLTMHPVELEPLARLVVLGEKKFSLRSMSPLPRSHAALKRASLSQSEVPG